MDSGSENFSIGGLSWILVVESLMKLKVIDADVGSAYIQAFEKELFFNFRTQIWGMGRVKNYHCQGII